MEEPKIHRTSVPAGTTFVWRRIHIEVETDMNVYGQQDYRWRRSPSHSWLSSMTLGPLQMPRYSERELELPEPAP